MGPGFASDRRDYLGASDCLSRLPHRVRLNRSSTPGDRLVVESQGGTVPVTGSRPPWMITALPSSSNNSLILNRSVTKRARSVPSSFRCLHSDATSVHARRGQWAPASVHAKAAMQEASKLGDLASKGFSANAAALLAHSRRDYREVEAVGSDCKMETRMCSHEAPLSLKPTPGPYLGLGKLSDHLSTFLGFLRARYRCSPVGAHSVGVQRPVQ